MTERLRQAKCIKTMESSAKTKVTFATTYFIKTCLLRYFYSFKSKLSHFTQCVRKSIDEYDQFNHGQNGRF